VKNDKMWIKTFNWTKEIDLLMRMWLKCKDDDERSRNKAEKYASNLMERNNRMFTAPRETKNDKLDKPIINKKSKEKLIDKLKESNHAPHLFIIQCLYQGCCRYFKNEDDLKKHLQEKHGCADAVTNNKNVYGIAQLYHKEYI
jgi:hypothetical protein